MYQCAEINNTTNACMEWVQVGLLGLPDITNEQANLIIVAVTGLLVTAFLFKLFRHSI